MTDKSSHATDSASEEPTSAQLAELFRQIESGRISKENLQAFLRGKPASSPEKRLAPPLPSAISRLTVEETELFTQTWEKFFPERGRAIAEHLGKLQLPMHFPIAKRGDSVLKNLGQAIFWRPVRAEFLVLQNGQFTNHRWWKSSKPQGSMVDDQLRPFMSHHQVYRYQKSYTIIGVYYEVLAGLHRQMIRSQLRQVYKDAEKEFKLDGSDNWCSLLAGNLQQLVCLTIDQVCQKGTAPDLIPLLRNWETGYWPVSITDDGVVYYLAVE